MVHINVDEKILTEAENVNKDDMNKYIKKIVNIALEHDNIENKEVHISIESADSKRIRQLNKEYRNIDKETDVLSFPMFEKDELEKTKFKYIELGDIVICLDIVRKQSVEYKTGMKRELLYMITHGVCHLLRI